MRMIDLDDVALEEGPGREGFWFRAAELGPLIGAEMFGAGLYEAREGVPIWPYHYHYPDEEWLYVLHGTPVLRDAGGRRPLRAGDLVCFPAGHRGAHTVDGPGRFIIFSRGRAQGPFVSVYPDSDKVSVVPGPVETGTVNRMMLERASPVEYWHGEGSGAVPPVAAVREPDGVPGPPLVNLAELTFPAEPESAPEAETAPGAGAAPETTPERKTGRRTAPLGSALGADRLDGAVLELDPGAGNGPYRYHHGREQWAIVLSGTPTLRHPDGERVLAPGDLFCLPDGPAGARSIRNDGDGPARLLALWTTGYPVAACEPETGRWWLRTGPGAADIPLRDR